MNFKFGYMFDLDIGVDFGSFKTLGVSPELGVFFDKPTLISFHLKDRSVISVGVGASEMLGRVPKGVSVVRPIQNSEIFLTPILNCMSKIY